MATVKPQKKFEAHAKLLIKYRQATGKTQGWMAAKLGVSDQKISNIEKALCAIPWKRIPHLSWRFEV